MNIMKAFPLYATIVALAACGAREPGNPVKRVKNSPEIQAKLAEFDKQDHRIQLNGCEQLYNGKPFGPGMTLSDLHSVFGPHDFIYKHYHVWKEAGIVIAIWPDDRELADTATSMTMYLADTDKSRRKRPDYRQPKQDYLLIEGVPLNLNTPFKTFIDSSTFTLDDFLLSNYDYSLTYECPKLAKNILYIIDADGVWNYSGGGHLQLKSGPNQNNLSLIESVTIEFKND